MIKLIAFSCSIFRIQIWFSSNKGTKNELPATHTLNLFPTYTHLPFLRLTQKITESLICGLLDEAAAAAI